VWHSHADEMYGYALRALGDRAAADDAVQEAFVRAWRAAGSYDTSRPLRAWLFAILRNVVVDEARARSRRPEPTDSPVEPADLERMDHLVDEWVVHEALRRIRTDQRVVLVETFYRRRPYADVALELGIPEATARTRAYYGLRALRLALEEMGWSL
jgi:RNA polymerase sigma-70 factor, ECF subfamily